MFYLKSNILNIFFINIVKKQSTHITNHADHSCSLQCHVVLISILANIDHFTLGLGPAHALVTSVVENSVPLDCFPSSKFISKLKL